MKHWRYDARMKSRSTSKSAMWASRDRSLVSLEISREEWRDVHRWMHLSLGEDESKPNGHLLLETWGTRRRWVATDQVQLVLVENTSPAPVGEYDRSKPWSVMVNPRLFQGADVCDASLSVSGEKGRRTVSLIRPGLTVSMPEPPGSFPQWRVPFAQVSGVEVSVDANVLLEASNCVSFRPAGVECTARPPMWLSVSDGRLFVEATWPGSAPVTVELSVTRSTPNCQPVAVDPWRLGSLLLAVEDRDVVLTLPANGTSPVGLKSDGYSAVLKPLDRNGPARERLEIALKQFLNLSSLQPDEDGDYGVLSPDGDQLWIRLHTDAEPICVQVFSVLATEVEHSPALMEELNAINTSAAYVKVLWVDGGVLAETDLVAESITRSEIGNALSLVAETVAKYRSILGAFFGPELEGN